MRLLLMTTTDMHSDRRRDLDRMIASVANGIPSGCPVHHLLLLQRATEEQRAELAGAMPYPATILATPDRISLSAARNLMLDYAREHSLLDAATLVGYPDDDCWYPESFLSRLVAEFERDDDRGHAFTKPGHVANQTGRFGLGIANTQAE